MSARFAACVLLFAFDAAAFAVAPPGRLSRPQREALARADALAEQAESLRREGKPKAALTSCLARIEAVEAVYGADHMQTVGALGQQVRLHLASRDWAAAAEARARQAGILGRLFGRYDWRALSAGQDADELRLRGRLTDEQMRQLARAEEQRDLALDRAAGHKPREAIRPILDSHWAFVRVLGETNSRSLRTLLDLAGIAALAGDRPSARMLYGRAGALIARTRTERHPEYAEWLGWVAKLEHESGRDDLAAPAGRRQVRLLRETTGESTYEYGIAQGNLGVYLTAQEEYADAESALLAGRKVLLARGGKDDPAYASTFNNLGLLYSATRKYDEAADEYARAIELRLAIHGKTHPLYAQSVSNFAELLMAAGETRESLRLTEKALKLFSDAHGRVHYDCAICLHRLGDLWRDLGDNRKAAALLEESAAILRETRGKNDPRRLRCLNDLGSFYRDLGDFPRARARLEECLAVRKEVHGEASPAVATALHNLAYLHGAFKDDEAALALYQRSLAIRTATLGAKHALVGGSLHNLGMVLSRLGRHRQARERYEQALSILEATRGKSHVDTLTCRENLAMLRWLDGERGGAIRDLTEVLALAGTAKLPPRDLARSAHNLAVLHADAGDWNEARGRALESLRLMRQAGLANHPHYAASLRLLAEKDWLDRKGGAALLSGQALEVIRRFADRNLDTLSDRQRRDFLDAYASTLSQFVSLASDSLTPAQLYDRVLVFKGALNARAGRDLSARDTPEVRDLRARLARARADLARMGDRPRADAVWSERFDALERQKEELEIRLAEASAGAPHPKATSAQVAAALPRGAALVELLVSERTRRPAKAGGRARFESCVDAFIVRAGHDPERIDLGEAAPLVEAIAKWRSSALGKGEPDEKPAELLRKRLWEPIERRLGGARTVLIAPDQEFCSLPFAALPGNKVGTFLVEEYTFGQLVSGRDLLTGKAGRAGDGLLVLGGAKFGPVPKSGGYGPLPGTAEESRLIFERYRERFADSPTRRLFGDDAGRGELLRALAGKRAWRYVHLGTHGYFAEATGRGGARFERNPMLMSGLALSGANRGPEGLLTAEEIAGLDLRGCDLAVLSACQTGAGRLAGWQGVQGLQRAFHLAGARHVAASLWSVDDAATSLLMEEFYARLWDPRNRSTPAEALRQAQLVVLKHPDRVRKRSEELHAKLKDLGLPESALASRGVKPKAKSSQDAKSLPTRGAVVQWAAWVVSGG